MSLETTHRVVTRYGNNRKGTQAGLRKASRVSSLSPTVREGWGRRPGKENRTGAAFTAQGGAAQKHRCQSPGVHHAGGSQAGADTQDTARGQMGPAVTNQGSPSLKENKHEEIRKGGQRTRHKY